jgi:hypothetical protein
MNDYEIAATQAHLVLVEQSGNKHDIPQPSTGQAIVEAHQVMCRSGGHLREVKVIEQNTAIARWRGDEFGWHRVA